MSVLPKLFSKLLPGKKRAPDPLDRPLMQWSKFDAFTVRDLLNGGVLVQGKTGSGKSSGPGKKMMRALIDHPRSGGLVRCAKPEDAAEARELFRQAGRLDDLLVFRPDQGLRFNLLDFVAGQGGGTRAVVHALSTIAETIHGTEGNGGGEEGSFWIEGRDRMLFHAAHVLKLAGERVSGPTLQRFIVTAAQDREQLASPEWQGQYHNQVLKRAFDGRKTPMEEHDWANDVDFWLSEHPSMAAKTRSSILAHVTNLLHVFNSGTVRELLSTTTNFTPLDTFAGKWVLSDMPPTPEGRFVNSAMVYMTQQAVLRREAKPSDGPVVIYCDEYQEAVNSADPLFIAQSRSRNAAMVCLTQSLPGLYARFRGQNGKSQADALVANLGTQVFCCCDPQTAQYASGWLGEHREVSIGGSMAPRESVWDELMGRARFSGNFSESYQPVLRPTAFMSGLRTGGPANRGVVDAIVVRNDRPFSTGQHFLKASFKQG